MCCWQVTAGYPPAGHAANHTNQPATHRPRDRSIATTYLFIYLWPTERVQQQLGGDCRSRLHSKPRRRGGDGAAAPGYSGSRGPEFDQKLARSRSGPTGLPGAARDGGTASHPLCTARCVRARPPRSARHTWATVALPSPELCRRGHSASVLMQREPNRRLQAHSAATSCWQARGACEASRWSRRPSSSSSARSAAARRSAHLASPPLPLSSWRHGCAPDKRGRGVARWRFPSRCSAVSLRAPHVARGGHLRPLTRTDSHCSRRFLHRCRKA